MTESIDWLIAGLGNPGKTYAKNRHNIGWFVAESLGEKYKKPINKSANSYYYTLLKIYSDNILVILPTTYMNKSGIAIKSA